MLPNPKPMTYEPIYIHSSMLKIIQLRNIYYYMISIFYPSKYFYKIINIFLRSTEQKDLQRSHHREYFFVSLFNGWF